MDYVIARADYEDLPEILALQKLCFTEVGDLYDNYDIPPLTQTLDEIREDFKRKIFLKYMLHGMIIGSVNGCNESGECEINRLIVHPEHRHRGIGSLLMREIEKLFSQAQSYVLFTGHRQEDNIRLYEELGYGVVKKEKSGDYDDIELVFMSKPNKG